MTNIITNLLNDEAGFIVSAELVLVATIGVLSLIVGILVTGVITSLLVAPKNGKS